VPSIELPYTDVLGTGSRPYLSLALTGPSGEPLDVLGLLDTGADSTALPQGDAALMGYTEEMLVYTTIGTADGVGGGFRVTEPAAAELPGAPSVPISLDPIVLPWARLALWGRTDVMRPFKVLFDELAQSFTLSW
jgi:hypothetical protein